MTDTPEMPEMVPPAIYRAAGIRETTRAINEIDAAYRDGFTAGVLAERSRALDAEIKAALAAGDAANRQLAADCRITPEMANRPCYVPPNAATERYVTPVDVAAIRKATICDVADVLTKLAKDAIDLIEKTENPICEIQERARAHILHRAVNAIHSLLADHPPAQPVDDGWRSDMEAAKRHGERFLALATIVYDEYDENDALIARGKVETYQVVAQYDPLFGFIEFPWRGSPYDGPSGPKPINVTFAKWRPLPTPPAPETPDGK